MVTTRSSLSLLLTLATFACSAPRDAPKEKARPSEAASSAATPPVEADLADDEKAPPPVYESVLPEEMRSRVDEPFTGDMDAMLARRMIRAGVPFNRSFYFIDKGRQRGLSYEYLMLFEEQLNKKLKTGNLKVHVILLPMPRDALLPALQSGKVDLVAAQLTVTPERQKLVDFSAPTRRNVSEVVVTGPGARRLTSLDDLSGRDVFVRKTSSYYDSLQELNRKLLAKGKSKVVVREASESLEDDDLLEMVNAGLIGTTVVDSYLADYWKQVFTNLKVHRELTVRTGASLAVATRKGSPKLLARLDQFIAGYGLDSAFGRIVGKRYLNSTRFVKNAASQAERRKFLAMVELFRKYGDRYKFDYLLMAAQGYQESKLNQRAKSRVGAVGVMQLMPRTGREQKVGDIRQLEPNIHAGVKYMRFVRDEFFEDQPMDDLNKGLFTFASYNAGPGRIRQLRREAKQRGLDQNVWFGNVERIASERIGRETVTYVSNIYKYYVAYRLLAEERERRDAAKAALRKGRG